MKKFLKVLFIVLLVILIIAIAFGLQAAALWLVGNWVLKLFSIGFKLTYVQCLGITMLLNLIGGMFNVSVNGGE